MVICLKWGADLHMAQLMPLPLTVSCFSRIHIGFTFLLPAHPGSAGQRPLNVCACVRACVLWHWWLMVGSMDILPHSISRHRFFSGMGASELAGKWLARSPKNSCWIWSHEDFSVWLCDTAVTGYCLEYSHILLVWQAGMTLHCRITKIDIERFQVELTSRTSDLVDDDNKWKYVVISISELLLLLLLLHIQGGQKSCTFFSTPYLWNRLFKTKWCTMRFSPKCSQSFSE